MSNIDVRWLADVTDPKEQEQLKASLKSSEILQRLTRIVAQALAEAQANRSVDYDSPSWAYKQADKNGRVSAYESVMKLINNKE